MDEKEIKILEELKKGKSLKEAAESASTKEIVVKRWIQWGKDGDESYIEFYNEYKKIKPKKQKSVKKSAKEIVDDCVKLLEEGFDYKEISHKLNIPEFRLKNFYTQGKLGIKPYDKYYKASEEAKKRKKGKKDESNIFKKLSKLDLKELDYILEDNNCFLLIPNKNIKIQKIKDEIPPEDIEESLEKLAEIKIIEDKIIKQLNKFSVKSLLKYLSPRDSILYINKPRKKITKKIIKDLKFSDMEEFYEGLFEVRPVEIYEGKEDIQLDITRLIEETRNKKCVICGKKLNPVSKKDKCKTCLRSIHAANTLNELLNYIQPKIPFYKEDLQKIGYQNDKLLDTIWVLQENDLLIVESTNKYSLVRKEILDDFLDKWGEYVKNRKVIDTTTKLSKECVICKKTKAISLFNHSVSSADGFKDYCKDCERPVNAARSLKTLLNYVGPKQVFRKEKMYSNYPEPFLLDSSIFLLQEHDLIETNPDGERFRLTDEKVLDDFLEKYYIEEEGRPKTPIRTSPQPIIEEEEDVVEEPVEEELEEPIEEEEPVESSDIDDDSELRRKMDIVLYYLKDGFTEKEAFNFADLNKSTLITWKNLGKKGNEPYAYFYTEYMKLNNPDSIEEENQEEKEIKEKMDFFTEEIVVTGSVKTAFNNSEITKEEFIAWIKLGNSGETFYKNFIDQYLNSLRYVINEEIRTLRIKEAKKLMIQGYDIEEAAEHANKIDFSKKEKEIEEKLTKEVDDLVNEVVVEPTNTKKYGLKFKIISKDPNTGLLTLQIIGKVRNEHLEQIVGILKDYPREIDKILTKDSEDNSCDILIEMQIENTELQDIRSLLNEFS